MVFFFLQRRVLTKTHLDPYFNFLKSQNRVSLVLFIFWIFCNFLPKSENAFKTTDFFRRFSRFSPKNLWAIDYSLACFFLFFMKKM